MPINYGSNDVSTSGIVTATSGNFTNLLVNGSSFSSSVSGLLPTIANSGNDRILTSTGTSTGINAESNLKFDSNNNLVGGSSNSVSGTTNSLLFGSNNTLTSSAYFDSNRNFVVGGKNSCTYSNFYLLPGGNVIGGVGNSIANGTNNAVFGGSTTYEDSWGNTLSSYSSYNLVAGRLNDLNNSTNSLVVGQNHDLSSSSNTFVCGNNNTITGSNYSSILGGQNNTANHSNVFILGSNITSSASNTTYTENLRASGTITGNQLNIDNLRLDANTLSSTNTNGNIVIQPAGSGQIVASGVLTAASGAITTLTTVPTFVSPAALSSDQGNWNPGTGDVIRMSATTGVSISGIVLGVEYTRVLINVGSTHNITLKHEASAATSGNRIITSTGGDHIIPPTGAVSILYDIVDSRWRVL